MAESTPDSQVGRFATLIVFHIQLFQFCVYVFIHDVVDDYGTDDLHSTHTAWRFASAHSNRSASRNGHFSVPHEPSQFSIV